MIQSFRPDSFDGALLELAAGFRAAIDAKFRERHPSGYKSLEEFATSDDLLVEEALEWAKGAIEEASELTPSYVMISLAAGYGVRFSCNGLADATTMEQARWLLPIMELMNSVPIDVYTLVTEIWFADTHSEDLRRGVRPCECSDRQEGLMVVVARPGGAEYHQYRTVRRDDGITFEFVRMAAPQKLQIVLASLFDCLPNAQELRTILYDEPEARSQVLN